MSGEHQVAPATDPIGQNDPIHAQGLHLPPWLIKASRWFLTALGIAGGTIFVYGISVGTNDSAVRTFEVHIARDEARWPEITASHHEIDKRVTVIESEIGVIKTQMVGVNDDISRLSEDVRDSAKSQNRLERKVDEMLIRFSMSDVVKREGPAPEPKPWEVP